MGKLLLILLLAGALVEGFSSEEAPLLIDESHSTAAPAPLDAAD